MFKNFFRKLYRLWNDVGKYGAARQATYDNIVRHMRFDYWVTEVTNPRSEYVMLIDFTRP